MNYDIYIFIHIIRILDKTQFFQAKYDILDKDTYNQDENR